MLQTFVHNGKRKKPLARSEIRAKNKAVKEKSSFPMALQLAFLDYADKSAWTRGEWNKKGKDEEKPQPNCVEGT